MPPRPESLQLQASRAGRPLVVAAAVLPALLMLRFSPASWLQLLPPCPIYQTFGILCPGCGATRALLALLHGDLATAWQSNPLLVLFVPLLALYLVLPARARTLQPHRRLPHIPTHLTAALILGALGFSLARNLRF